MTAVTIVEIIDINFDNICRLCMTSDNDLSNIFKDEEVLSSSEWSLAEKISDSTSLQVQEEDGLPSHICSVCINLVNSLHSFKQRCISTDLTLREYLRIDSSIESENEGKHNNNKISRKDSVYQRSIYSSNKVKSEPTNEDLDETEHNDGIIAHPEIKPSSSCSPPPDSRWDCEAVDVEVKVEITESPDEVPSGRPKRKTRRKSEKMTIFKDGVFPCPRCKKVFAHKTSLTRHESIHSDEKFICMFCGKKLTTRDTLIRHVRAHTGDKRYRCEHCGKSYTSSTSYTSHVRKHTGERPYKCPECNERFSLSSSLDRHVAKHKGTKEFICEVCDASFWVADDLRCHVNRIH